MSRSGTVATVMALLRRRTAMRPSPADERQADGWLPPDLASLDWRQAIAFASAHFVLAGLAPALRTAPAANRAPAEVEAFLVGITDANADRNRMLLARLAEACHGLEAIGIVPVALKGAAFLVEDQAQAADWRFMQDLDLLVPSARLDAAVAALADLGYRPAATDYDAGREAHYPPLLSPCGTFAIELHTRLFGLGDHGLEPDAIRREAVPAKVGGTGVLLPSPRHRLGHLLVHAQVHNRFHAAKRLVLKDLVDLSMLAARHGECVEACVVDALFAADPPVHRATRALLDAWAAWRDDARQVRADAGPWGRRALARLAWPAWRTRAALPLDLVRLELHRARFEAGHLARRLETLASPERLARTAFVWSAKQRQRLWG